MSNVDPDGWDDRASVAPPSSHPPPMIEGPSTPTKLPYNSTVRRRKGARDGLCSLSLDPSTVRSRNLSVHRRSVSAEDSLKSPTPVVGPLQVSSTNTQDAGITRPSLNRWLAEDKLDPPIKPNGVATPTRQAPSQEIEVFVHKVQSTDTIAGLALKYGIAVADLRKANQLWASDPIHLRRIIYIPLDWTSKKKRIHATNGDGSPHGTQLEGHSRTGDPTPPTLSTNTIRMTLAQLAHFPPPTRSAASVSKQASSTLQHHIHQSSSPNTTSLSLFNLNLPSLTHSTSLDAVFGRHSFDSWTETGSISTSNRSESDQEVELDVMETSSRIRSLPRSKPSDPKVPHWKAGVPSLSRHPFVETIRGTSGTVPSADVQFGHQIQTIQPQPQPGMTFYSKHPSSKLGF